MIIAKKPATIIKEIREALNRKGFSDNIPLDIFYAEFMFNTGYGKRKIWEWTQNFELIKLIEIKDGKVNFL